MATVQKKSYKPPLNDNITRGFGNLIPAEYRGNDKFLDVVTWNIRYFNDRDSKRVTRIVDVLEALNADIFVLEETYEGSLGVVVEQLQKRHAGYYEVTYGKTGGQQRIAIMSDIEWVRRKDEVRELFADKDIKTEGGKKAFWRRPLWSYFTAITQVEDPFDFQLVGLHLKSQRGGGEDQRTLEATTLCNWLTKEAPKVDADVMMLGDWNEGPESPAWEPFRKLEKKKKVLFSKINDASDISHLMFRTKKEIGSRLDMECIVTASGGQLAKGPTPARWKSLDALLDTNPNAAKLKEYIHDVGEQLSDHMPLVSRFYFEVKK